MSTPAGQAREAARRIDGRFGPYTADESAAQLLADPDGSHTEALGGQIASRGEHLAGISTEEVHTNWEARLDEATATRAAADPRPDAPGPDDLSDEDKIWIFQRRLAVHNGHDPGKAGFSRDEAPQAVVAVEFDRPASAQWVKANRHCEQVEAGVDPQTRQDLKKLTDGYLAALAEHQHQTTATGDAATGAKTLFSGAQGGMIGVGRCEADIQRRDAALGHLASIGQTGC